MLNEQDLGETKPHSLCSLTLPEGSLLQNTISRAASVLQERSVLGSEKARMQK